MAEERLGAWSPALSLSVISQLTMFQLSSLLEQKAVLLRLEAGSTEAGFLSAFCSISNTPTFIVIQYVIHILGSSWG